MINKYVCEDIDIYYDEKDATTIEICGLETDLDEVTLNIPEYIDEKKVVSIYDTAICGCNKIKKIVLPGTIKKITERSIQGCLALKEIILSDGIEEIGAYTFWGNTNIEKIKFPKTLKKISKRAFPTCENFLYLKLNEGLEEIEKSNFKFLNLNYLYIPSTLKKVGENVFYGSKIRTTVFKGSIEEFKVLKQKFNNVNFGRVLCII